MNQLYATVLETIRASASSPMTMVNVMMGILLTLLGVLLMNGKGFKMTRVNKQIGLGCMIIGLLAVVAGSIQIFLF